MLCRQLVEVHVEYGALANYNITYFGVTNMNRNIITDNGRYWAIQPDQINGYLTAVEDMQIDMIEANAKISSIAMSSVGSMVGNTLVLPLHGPITQRYGLMSFLFGGTSTDNFGKAFDNAINNPQVSSIVIDIDSPGGSVTGVTELAGKIRNARGRKPITAVANSLSASAAYWIGSAADSMYVTPSGDVGSIGVLALHQDMSGAYEQAGIVNTFIIADGSPFKVEGNEYEPLSEDARNEIQQDVNDIFDVFISDVAKNRGITKSDVRKNFGQGRLVSAKKALAAGGMVDGIATLEDILTRSAVTQRRGKKASVLRKRLEIME